MKTKQIPRPPVIVLFVVAPPYQLLSLAIFHRDPGAESTKKHLEG